MKNLSLRYKLMVITSGLIIVSLIVLSIISIRYFTQDKTQLIQGQMNDTVKLIADKLKTEISTKLDTLTVFDRLAGSGAKPATRKARRGRRAAKNAETVAPANDELIPESSGILRVSR